MLAIPPKRCDRAVVCFLTAAEIDALLAAPTAPPGSVAATTPCCCWPCQTGLRVSELTGLTRADVHLGAGAHVRCHGKGRKDRATPLTRQTVAVLRVWLAEHAGGPTDPLFPTRRASHSPATRSQARRQARRHRRRDLPEHR